MILRNQLSRSCKLKHADAARSYARVVGGMINSPPPPAPAPKTSFNVVRVSQRRDEKALPKEDTLHEADTEAIRPSSQNMKDLDPFSFDISRPPQLQDTGDFRTLREPPRLRPEHDLYEYLIGYASNTQAIQRSPNLKTMLEDLNAKANIELPQVLKNGNAGSPELSLEKITESIVTIAHILPPPANSTQAGDVILSSGFAILDGSLLATCTHPLHQINALCRSDDSHRQLANIKRARSIAITYDGTIIPIENIASHLVMSDLVLMRIAETNKLRPLKVNPYPCPTGNPILVYSLHDVTLSTPSEKLPRHPKGTWSWTDSEITLYQDRAGRESATGSYDELNTLLFNSVPRPGSSGGPIIDRDTKAVVGITRGSEISYAVRKERGFATPAESLFNVFKLDGF